MDAKSADWPAFNVERRPIGALKPYKGNARTHSEEQVAQIAASIREWGWTQPVLVDEKGGVIAGHGRLLAAQSLGVDEVPVIVARGWSKAQKQAYVLADNQIALNADWDRDLLKVEIGALGDMGFDTSLIGFGDDLLGDVVADRSGGSADPDEAPAPPVNPTTRLGDVWICGHHRIMCGDSTDEGHAARLRDGADIDCILTDPPYCSGGFQESGKSSGSVGTSAPHKQIANDRLSTRGYIALLKSAFGRYPAPFLYAFTDWRMWIHLFDIAESSGFGVRSMVVWDKRTPGMGRGWRSQHELILWAAKKTPPFDKHASGNGNVIGLPRTGNVNHTTEKPVELMERLLQAAPFIRTVVDPFIGSGTTAIACERQGVRCLGMELDPSYVDVVVERWQALTGGNATLEATGQIFEEVSSERYDPAKDSAASYDAAIAAKRERLQAAE